MGVEALGHGRDRPLAHYGPHLNPSEGCCRVLQDAMGAERCVSPLPQLSWRTRQGLMGPQERPIYAFHW